MGPMSWVFYSKPESGIETKTGIPVGVLSTLNGSFVLSDSDTHFKGTCARTVEH
jgi:hypothetical protein